MAYSLPCPVSEVAGAHTRVVVVLAPPSSVVPGLVTRDRPDNSVWYVFLFDNPWLLLAAIAAVGLGCATFRLGGARVSCLGRFVRLALFVAIPLVVALWLPCPADHTVDDRGVSATTVR